MSLSGNDMKIGNSKLSNVPPDVILLWDLGDTLEVFLIPGDVSLPFREHLSRVKNRFMNSVDLDSDTDRSLNTINWLVSPPKYQKVEYFRDSSTKKLLFDPSAKDVSWWGYKQDLNTLIKVRAPAVIITTGCLP